MSLFGRKVAEGGVYWLPGKYLVEIDVVKVHEGRKKRDFFIVSGKNLESDHEERKVGSKCSWVADLDNDATPGNIKSFLSGVLNVGLSDLEAEEWEKLYDRAIEDDNPLCGFTARLHVTNIKTRAGNDFSKHVWSPAQDGMTEEAEALLSKIMS
jgi:hypothetical protein